MEFALFDGGLCRGGHDLQEIYGDHGTTLSCSNGVGGKDSVALYSLTKTGTVESRYNQPHYKQVTGCINNIPHRRQSYLQSNELEPGTAV